jgi:hypothetical protein
MSQNEIDAVRTLLCSKPRLVGLAERGLDDFIWPVADDVKLAAVDADADGVPAEWSIVPGSEGRGL